MNLFASCNWISDFLKTKSTPEEFAREISLRSVSVESIEDLRDRYENMVIGVVEKVEQHPDADKLKLAQTNIGKETVTIVCGGANLAEGQKVVVAQEGAKVHWHGESDMTILKPATIRGVASEGMICAAEEIGFEKAQTGPEDIWDLTEICDAPAGTPLVKAFGIEDSLFDIEVTTNRPDAMNIIGIAREAGACGLGEFTWKPSELPAAGSALPVSVKVEDKERCERYIGVALENVKVGPSPLWLQMRVLLSGHRPINNVVDITNYILHEYGQPLHAFDYDKVADGGIIVRTAKTGEKITALDEKGYELKDTHLLITDKNGPLAVAGVMGGQGSGTYEGTTRILLEAATFNGAHVRCTARDLNLYSDSQSMYEKGLSTESLEPALARAIELLQELAGATVASEYVDVRSKEYTPEKFTLNPARVNQLLGVEIAEKEQVAILEKLGFTCEKNGEIYDVTVPYFRDHDIEENVDLLEEIARVYGYHNIPPRMPSGRLPARVNNAHLHWQEMWKRDLVSFGFTEFFSNSLVSVEDLERVNVNPESALKIFNPLTVDLTHMRTTLLSGILKGVALNQVHHKTGNIFEISRVYTPRKKDLPTETTDMIIAKYGYTDGLDAFRELKGALSGLLAKGGKEVEYDRLEDHELLHRTRAARILVDGKEYGYIGEVREEITERFGVNVPVMVLVLHAEDLIPELHRTRTYNAEPAFPPVLRDLSLLVDTQLEFTPVENAIQGLDERIRNVEFIDQYDGKGIPEGKKSITLSLTIRDDEKTLEGSEIETLMKEVGDALHDSFEAEIR